MMREPATEAVYNIDDRLARRVLDGVFRFEGVEGAQLVVGEDEVLARVTPNAGRQPLPLRHRRSVGAIAATTRSRCWPNSGEKVGSLRLQLVHLPARPRLLPGPRRPWSFAWAC
jgi:hypothetical protein